MQPTRKVEKPITQPTVLFTQSLSRRAFSTYKGVHTHRRFSVRSSPIAHIPLPT